jgi:hypothetical protein
MKPVGCHRKKCDESQRPKQRQWNRFAGDASDAFIADGHPEEGLSSAPLAKPNLSRSGCIDLAKESKVDERRRPSHGSSPGDRSVPGSPCIFEKDGEERLLTVNR